MPHERSSATSPDAGSSTSGSPAARLPPPTGVDGPYSVLLCANAYTKASETTEHGYPILEHINQLVDGDIIWAPPIDGAFVLTTRGGASISN